MRAVRSARPALDREAAGVSEIVGDILLVSIAVVMISALALQMGTVEQPPEKTMASLEATYDGAEILVKHLGGDPLENSSTRFNIFLNDTLSSSLSVSDGHPSDGRLETGESWSHPFTAGPDDTLRLQIVDRKAPTVIFDRILQGGAISALLPDLGLGPGDIEILRHGAPVDENLNTPLTNETLVINATIHNYGGSGVPGVRVRMSDYSSLDRLSIDFANITIPWLGAGNSTCVSASYRIQNGSWGMHSLTVKIIPFHNESRFSNNNAVVQYRVGYPVIATSPTRPYLVVKSIEFSDEHPVHGSTVIISSKIVNQGGVPAYATVRFYDGSYSRLIGELTGVGIPVGGETISTAFWKTGSGGLHTIIVNATEPNGTGGEASRELEVMPTILLVDDDRAAEGSVRDVVTPMSAALESVGATYTTHVVAGGDGPRYDSGEHPMRDFDLVIWMTGFEDTTTLTPNDQMELTKYLINGHGKLWLIGQGILSDLGLSNAFLVSILNVDPIATLPSYLDAGTPDPLVGTGILPGASFNISTPYPPGLLNKGDFVEPRPFAASALVEAVAPNRPVGILFNATTNMTPGVETYTSAFFSFELTRMKRPGERSILTYTMLEWFNCSARWGRDLSISEQEFNITTPTFMDQVNITVLVRNNGLNDEPPSFLNPILQLGFYIDGRAFDPARVTVENSTQLWEFDLATSELWIPQNTPHPSLVVPGRGGYLKVSMVWVADQVGLHTVTVKVDPYDYIEEINELNNKVASAVANEVIFVRYGTLLVDDDGSANNGGTLYNATQNVSRALNALGYDFDVFVVPTGADGPDLNKMSQYNAIIWCAGESPDALTASDRSNLQDFLKKGDGRGLWLIGQKAVLPGDYSSGSDPFCRDFLRVALVSDPASHTPSTIEGVYMDPVSHGISYPAQPTFTDKGGLLVPYIDGHGILFQSPLASASSERNLCDAEDGSTARWFARVVPPGTTASIYNVQDTSRGSRVILLNRTGASAQSTVFIIGDFSATNNQNPNDLFWDERSRLTARWSFSFQVEASFGWHVTDTTNAHRTLFYSTSDANIPGPNPVFGLGSWTMDGSWHSVTRDLTEDLRHGTGNMGLGIKSVDGFEVWMGEGEGRVDGISLCRPFNSVRHDNATHNFRSVWTAWDASFISYDGNDNYLSELTYLVMRWFHLYESRTELRVTSMDLYYSGMVPLREMKPMLGESYVLKAMVWNLGGTRGDAVVRFTDGTTVIDSVTVSVEANGRAMAEIVWRPLFAGSRVIGATVDPDNTVSETMKFNNVAGVGLDCYFFYDDLESGTKNWRHEATVLRINGESALEYLDPGVANTNIIQGWQEMDGWYNTTDNASLPNITSVYRSWPRAFYMHESRQDIRRPVDCTIIIDRSGSMSGQKIQDAKNAAMFFITQLESIDRISVWSFSTGVTMDLGFTFNKSACINAIKGLSAGGWTAGWTAMYQGTNYTIQNSRPGAMRAVVFLTDGNFNADSGMYTKANTTALIATMHGPLFTIGLGGDVNTANLQDAAAASEGGSYYYAPTSDQLLEIYSQIAQVIQQLAQSLGRSTPEGGASGRAQVTVFYDSFENATPVWTTVNGGAAGSQWVRHSGIKHNGSFAYRSFNTGTGNYDNNDNNSLISPVFDLSGRQNPRLAFWSMPCLGNNGDWCRVYVSNNGGTSWTQVWSTNANSNNWQYECYIDLTAGGAVTPTSSMMLRFQFTSDGSSVASGWVVDEVLVTSDVPLAGGEGIRYWMNGDEVPRDRNLTTKTFSLLGVTSAKLTFWHKYDLKAGANGGVLMVGTAASESGPYTYRYITPTQPYTGNLQIAQWGTPHLKDGFGNDIRWCWNGVSGSGRFTWDYVEADLTPFIGNQFVRVRFAYIYCTGGTGMGWAIDDIEVRVERANAVPVSASVPDQWELVRKGDVLGGGGDIADAYSGEWAWLCHSPSPGIDYLAAGIDNSLTTIPIDLTNALDARLDARLKFNINSLDGRPPDGLRVEVSSDNGITWRALNRGVRSGWKVSGTEAAGPDGTSATGVDLGGNWVASGTMSRLNCDLSGWAGSVILLRFRVVTRTDIADHYHSALAGFGGVYIDDIKVVGNTTTGGRAAGPVERSVTSACHSGAEAEEEVGAGGKVCYGDEGADSRPVESSSPDPASGEEGAGLRGMMLGPLGLVAVPATPAQVRPRGGEME
ncbi:MAG: CARDB domain-containing protein [Thermoplasmata archaeon]